MDSRRRLANLDRMLKRAFDGEMALGMYMSVPSAPMIDIAGRLGLEWLIINMEHGAIESWPEVREVAQAADLADIPFMVKLTEWRETEAHHALDLGAIGIIVPKVRSADELRMMSKSIKFPPGGSRGYCPISRGNQWGAEWLTENFGEEYEAYWQLARRTLIIPMIETKQAVENLDAILDVEECPIVFPGPADLGVEYSRDSRFDPDEEKRLGELISGKLKARTDRLLMSFQPELTEAGVSRLFELGVRMPVMVDLWAFGGALHTGVKNLRAGRDTRRSKR